MKKLFFLVVLFLSACGYREGIVQRAEKGFIKFTGNLENASVQIDNQEQFALQGLKDSNRKEGEDSSDRKLYQISPGKHTLKVYRDGTLLINRILLIDNQTITEVIIP